MIKQKGQLFKLREQIKYQFISIYNPNYLTDYCEDEVRITSGDIGMFIGELAVPWAVVVKSGYCLGPNDKYLMFEVYLFGDKVLQMEREHARNALEILK